MSSADRFKGYDAQHNIDEEYERWINQKDARLAEFHSTVGKRTLRLAKRFGIASRQRYTEHVEGWDFARIYHTEITSKPKDFEPTHDIRSARIHVVRSIDTLPTPFPIIGLSRKAAGYLTRTGLGEITETTIDYEDSTYPGIRSLTLNKFIYRESTPFISEGYAGRNITDEANVDNFVDLLTSLEGQL